MGAPLSKSINKKKAYAELKLADKLLGFEENDEGDDLFTQRLELDLDDTANYQLPKSLRDDLHKKIKAIINEALSE
jgi:hypothetical protein